MSVSQMTPQVFRTLPAVIDAVKHPRSARSVLHYMFGCGTADPQNRDALDTEEKLRHCLVFGLQVAPHWMICVSPLPLSSVN